MLRANQRRLSLLALFAATLAWGASFFLVKKATSQVGVWPFLFWRFGLASIFLSCIFPRKVFKAKKILILKGATLGVLLFLTIWTQTQGLQSTSATRSGFLTSLYVPFTPLVGWLLFKQRMYARQMLVALCAVLGLYIMTSQGSLASGLIQWWHDINPGDLWTVATAIVGAFQIIFTEKFSRSEPDSVGLGLWQFIWCFALAAGVSTTLHIQGPAQTLFETGSWNLLQWSQFSLISVVFNALITTCFGFIMQIIAQKTIGSLKAALIFALEAPFSSGFAHVFLGETLSFNEGIGAAVVFLTSIIPEPWLKSQKKEFKNHGSL